MQPLTLTSTTTPGLTAGANWVHPVDSARGRFLVALNAWRAQNGTGASAQPVQLDARLEALADYTSSACASEQFMAHDFPALDNGQPAMSFSQRFTAFYGYRYGGGENLAYGDYSGGTATYDGAGNLLSVDYAKLIDGVIKAFASDEGHRANLLSVGPAVGLSIAWSRPVPDPDAAADAPVRYKEPALPFFAQDFGGDPAIVPLDGPPPPAPGPVKGSHWRLKLNPLARPITVVGYDAATESVHAQNRKGQPLKMSLDVFLKRYKPA